MHLKYLEIQGFKSFPDRVRLEFGSGITAVVGPNGSGKSNIVDAVRWVFGEQSTKTLRGAKMEDIIFGGTQMRPQVGYCSVTITIDNSDGTLDFERGDVSVTRRLTRAGDSDYRINGTGVRLKDIHELFMDTGLGRDGYSIIGQGKIAEIVAAKSAGRREIFEEAAGISKYRYRKEEAERHLSAVEENLIRLKDILGELESRIAPLEKESGKAKEFLLLAEEKKQLEVSLCIQNLRGHKEKLREAEDKYIVAKSRYDETEKELEQIELEINARFSAMQQCIAGIDTCRNETKDLEQLISDRKARIAVGKNDLGHGERSLEKLREDLAGAAGSSEITEQNIARLSELLAECDRRTAELRAAGEAAKAARTEHENSLARLSEAAEVVRTRRAGIYSRLDAARAEGTGSSVLAGEAAERLEILKSGRSAKADGLAGLEREFSECERLLAEIAAATVSVENSKSGYALKYENRKQKYDALLENERAALERAKNHENRAKLLEEMERSLEGYANSVKHVLREAERGALAGIRGPVSGIVSADAAHALAVETALGAAMQNIVTDDEYSAKKAIEMLSRSKQGRATFLPVSSVKGTRLAEKGLENCAGFVGAACDLVKYDPKYEGIVLRLLGHTVVAEDLDAAVEMAKARSYRFRIVTLDGQVVNSGGSLTGGYSSRTAGILGRKNEIDKLGKLAAEEKHAAKQAADAAALIYGEISGLLAEIDAADAELKMHSEDKIRCESEIKLLNSAVANAREETKRAELEEKLLTERLEQLQTRTTEQEALLEHLGAELAECEAELEKLGASRTLGESLYREAERLVGEREFSLAGALKEREDTAASLEDLAAAARDGDERKKELLELIEQNARETARIHAEIAAAQAEVERAQERVTELAAEGERLAAERDENERAATEARAKVRSVTDARELLSRDLVRSEERKHSVSRDYDAVIARLWDEYELTRSAAEEIAKPVEDMQKAERRLTELKNKIRLLGNVNVGAIEEYAEISVRYNFLKTQTDDVEKSRTELLALIDELTSDMREIFLQNFGRINANFSEIFVQLFGGGKANLALTDENDVLGSGIEIFVQPPGKIIKNLATLSGGEQTFVAIAIYFAILKVNPSPFCLLDEIEAALDDVNVVKFAAYLRRMTDKTQFIAITHRRGTMEEADALYGVTMEEEGISKLLSLRVSEIEAKTGIKA